MATPRTIEIATAGPVILVSGSEALPLPGRYVRILRLAFFASLASFGAATSAIAAAAEDNWPATRIIHVTVIDVSSGQEAHDQTVVVVGDRIRSVRRSTKDHSLPSNRIVDGTEKYLIPGLWDIHVHGNNNPWYADWYPLYIANGVTGIREMFRPPNAARFRADLSARRLDAPHIYLGSPIVDGDPPAWPNSPIVRTPDDARRFVDEQQACGADFIKVYNLLTREAYFAIIDEARRMHIPVAGHVPYAVTVEEASAAHQKSIEHLYGISTACSDDAAALQARRALAKSRADRRVVDDDGERSYSEKGCRKLLSLLKLNETWQIPTLAVFNADLVAASDPQHADPRFRYFSAEGLKWLRGDFSPQSTLATAAGLARSREHLAFMMKVVGAMFRAGVPILAGTDTGNAYTFPGFSLHEELSLMVDAGATPLSAIQSATRNPAIFMRRTASYGAISAGKIADFVLLDADPLVDIHNSTRIAAVFLAGKYFDRAALDRLLSEAGAANAADRPGN